MKDLGAAGVLVGLATMLAAVVGVGLGSSATATSGHEIYDLVGTWQFGGGDCLGAVNGTLQIYRFNAATGHFFGIATTTTRDEKGIVPGQVPFDRLKLLATGTQQISGTESHVWSQGLDGKEGFAITMTSLVPQTGIGVTGILEDVLPHMTPGSASYPNAITTVGRSKCPPTATPYGPIAGSIGYNFTETSARTCATATAVSVKGGRIPASAAAGAGCPLTVTVDVRQPTRSGLAIDSGFRKYGPVNFSVPVTGGVYTEPGEAGQKCESGCTNVLVTVTDPITHLPVEGATVTVSVDPIPMEGLPYSNYGPSAAFPAHDDEFLCPQSYEAPATRCGTDLSLPTDRTGNVHLIYWAPGLVYDSRTTLHVKATATHTCVKGVCSGKPRKGEARPTTLTVDPYLIYQHPGVLSKEQVEELIAVFRDPGLFTVTNEIAKTTFETAFEQGLSWLVGTEEEAELAVEAIPVIFAEPIFGLIEAAHVSYELHEEDELLGTFLRAFDLPGIGIYDPPFEPKAPKYPSSAFESNILQGLANVGHVGTHGAMWADAEALSNQYGKSLFAVRPEQLHLDIYEVSSCSASDPRCGPGYENSPGIQPELCLTFSGTDDLPTPPLHWHDQDCMPYDAFAWVETQRNLNRATP